VVNELDFVTKMAASIRRLMALMFSLLMVGTNGILFPCVILAILNLEQVFGLVDL